MPKKGKGKERFRCEDCNASFWRESNYFSHQLDADEAAALNEEYPAYAKSGEAFKAGDWLQDNMVLCADCESDYDEPEYGIYGDREDQISYDSAMYRD